MTRSFSPIKYKYGDHRIDLRRGVHINLLVRQNQMCLFMGAFYGSKCKKIKSYHCGRSLEYWQYISCIFFLQKHMQFEYAKLSGCFISTKHLHKYILTSNNGIMTHVICLYNMLYHRYVIAYVFHSIPSILPLYFR